MFGIGMPELLLILIIGLIVFGPGKLPEAGRTLGKGLREFKKASNMLQQAMNEPEEPPKKKRRVKKEKTEEAEAEKDASALKESYNAVLGSSAPAAEAAKESAAGARLERVPETPAAGVSAGYEPPTQESVKKAMEAANAAQKEKDAAEQAKG